jgi:predicted aconitase with swiveling domain
LSRRDFRGRSLVPGTAEGEALVSERAFTFAHGVDPATGRVTDVRSDIRGAEVRGRVLFYPFGKGSTTASSWFLETVRLGNGPSSIVTDSVDLSAVIGSVMASLLYGRRIPVVSGFSAALRVAFKSGARVRVDGATGEVAILE